MFEISIAAAYGLTLTFIGFVLWLRRNRVAAAPAPDADLTSKVTMLEGAIKHGFQQIQERFEATDANQRALEKRIKTDVSGTLAAASQDGTHSRDWRHQGV